ncbi:MAG: CPBP family intramembrane glutamic endopeptidase [Pseudomonadota bacterium]
MQVWKYFGVIFLVSIPFWTFGAVADHEFLPGLPVSSLMIICPVAVAAAFVFRDQGTEGLNAFLLRAVDIHKLKLWAWLLAVMTMPAVMTLSAVWQMSFGGGLPQFEIDPLQTLSLFCLFFIAATAEELGWTGFAANPLIKSFGIVLAGLIIGFVAALWHIFPLLQADRSWSWIAWWFAGTISRRVLIVWAYERGGQSVFGASLFHTMSNLSWMMFPAMGSHFDPMVTACIMTSVTAVILLISYKVQKSEAPTL